MTEDRSLSYSWPETDLPASAVLLPKPITSAFPTAGGFPLWMKGGKLPEVLRRLPKGGPNAGKNTMTINIVNRVDDKVKVQNVLISVSDKSGLETFVPELVGINPEIRIFSTGGTFGRLQEILGPKAENCLTQVSDYTGQPETQGGLVKTLDFKIYLGLLTETYNDAHQADLQRTGAVALDMVVVNLYPFQATIEKSGVTVEQARGNIDIGGPCMIRASAKNLLRVASVVDPADYATVLQEMRDGQGALSLSLRYRLAQKAFAHTAVYDRAIADYLAGQPFEAFAGCYDQ